MNDITKLYVAYKAGYLGNNILDTYFIFIANIIYKEHLTVVEDVIIKKKFMERYRFDLPLPFIRQILGVGVNNNCFMEDHGKYRVAIEKLSNYNFNETDFNTLWERLINEFEKYCQENDIDISSLDTNAYVLNILDDTDEKILSGEKIDNNDQGISSVDYAWYSFIKKHGEMNTDLYSFISALSASNITKQALFYAGETTTDYSDLHVFLDSPIIFALLGMDEESRIESYKKLIGDMLQSKCHIHVFDHVFNEVDGIICRAAGWATSTKYDLNKANNATRFFHDLQMGETEISEFCQNIESKLNKLGITVIETSYDIYQNDFQEDESTLFDMVKTRYNEHGYELTQEKEESIRIDVRSIIMIYRKRQGQTATRLQNAKHIMLTSNNAIANVSKKYESNRSTQSGHIPACISADLFGAVLWLDSPIKLLEYQKQKLLADCYAFLRPDKTLLDKYIKSLDEARNADAIDEKKFLFLRTHKVVLDSLMDITKGDYARFNSNTYLEVYEDIQSKSQKQYKDEAAAHQQTREKLKKLEESSADNKRKSDEEISALKKRIFSMEEKEANRQRKIKENKIKRKGVFYTTLFIGIPYVIALVVIEIIKAQFTSVSWKTFFYVGVFVLISAIILPLGFTKGKQRCYSYARKKVENKENSNK